MKLEPSKLLKTGQPLELSCKVQGTPVITVTWFKNGSEMVSDRRHNMTFDGSLATLEVESCSVEDSADYVCVASSEAGREQCSSSVTVKGWFTLHRSKTPFPTPRLNLIQDAGLHLGLVCETC